MENALQHFSKNLFWDADPQQFDLDAYPRYVIERVLECGRMKDWQFILHYYGLPKIVEECKQMRTLDKKALAFICCISDTKKEDYRCYHFAQSFPTLWNS